MPRLIDHPRASFKNGQEIAAAVDYLGGSCTIASCADKMKKKVSGAFKALISAGVKHGLVYLKKDILSTTELFKTYKLGYDEVEKLETLRKAFLAPPIYQKIYERFKGKDLPVGMLDKLLIRELGVEEKYGSRVAGYFIDGAKSVNILENGKLIDDIKVVPLDIEENDFDEEDDTNENNVGKDLKPSIKITKQETGSNFIQQNGNSFVISISGPGMNTKIEIKEEDDLLILDAMLNKIKKKLKEGSE